MVLAFEELMRAIEEDCETVCMEYRERHGIRGTPLHCEDEPCYGHCPFTGIIHGTRYGWKLLEEKEYLALLRKASLYDEMQGRHNHPHGAQFRFVMLSEED